MGAPERAGFPRAASTRARHAARRGRAASRTSAVGLEQLSSAPSSPEVRLRARPSLGLLLAAFVGVSNRRLGYPPNPEPSSFPGCGTERNPSFLRVRRPRLSVETPKPPSRPHDRTAPPLIISAHRQRHRDQPLPGGGSRRSHHHSRLRPMGGSWEARRHDPGVAGGASPSPPLASLTSSSLSRSSTVLAPRRSRSFARRGRKIPQRASTLV